MLLELLQGVTHRGQSAVYYDTHDDPGTEPPRPRGRALSRAEAWYDGMLLVPWRVAALLFAGPQGVHVTFHHEVRQQRLVEELYFVVRLPAQQQGP